MFRLKNNCCIFILYIYAYSYFECIYIISYLLLFFNCTLVKYRKQYDVYKYGLHCRLKIIKHYLA